MDSLESPSPPCPPGPPPSSLRISPTASPASPTPPAIADTIVDLASDRPAATIFGADPRSDLPPLVSGDFNGDGVADILLGARFGDGPSNRRQDAGEAYLIFGSPASRGDIDLAAGEQDVTIWGADPDDNLSFSAAPPTSTPTASRTR